VQGLILLPECSVLLFITIFNVRWWMKPKTSMIPNVPVLIVKFIVRHICFSARMSLVFVFLPSTGFCCHISVVYLCVVTDNNNREFQSIQADFLYLSLHESVVGVINTFTNKSTRLRITWFLDLTQHIVFQSQAQHVCVLCWNTR
jgi:hypothetical protein